MKWEKGTYWITDDPTAVNLDFVTDALHTTYWAKERPRTTIEKACAFRCSVVICPGHTNRHGTYYRRSSDICLDLRCFC